MEVRYTRYAGLAANSLPIRFVMKKDKLEITVLIDEWKNNNSNLRGTGEIKFVSACCRAPPRWLP